VPELTDTHTRLNASQVTDDQLDALYTERDALLDELEGRDDAARERWIEKQLAETGLKSMDFRNGMNMEIKPARELVAHWVAAARTMLGDAPNYSETPIEMEVKVAESPERFAFVLQRVAPDALTPHQARQMAEGERDRARGTAVTLENLLAAVADYLHYSDDDGIRTRETVLRMLAADESQPDHVAGDPDHCPACRLLPASQVPDILCPGPTEGTAH
jgi:hypothetical protein